MSAEDARDWDALRSPEGLNGWRASEPELAEDDEFGRLLVTLRRVVSDDWQYETTWSYGVDEDDARVMAVECARAGGPG